MLAYAIIAAKSTSIWPDLCLKNVQILLGIESCESIFFANQTPGVRSFSWSKDLWCEFVWPLRKVPVVFLGTAVKGDPDMGGAFGFGVSRCETSNRKKTKSELALGTESWRFKLQPPSWSWKDDGNTELEIDDGNKYIFFLGVGMVSFQRLLETSGGSVSW